MNILPFTAASVPVDSHRPLVICDADEVLLRFLDGLERHLHAQELYLDLTSYALTGNIKHRANDVALSHDDVRKVLGSFYDGPGLSLDAAEGAAQALNRFAAHASVVVLSNVSPQAAAGRARNLADHGMAFPVIPNEGMKGAAVHALAARTQGPVVFIDDSAWHHASVAEYGAGVHLIHFVADPRLLKLTKPSAHARLFTGDWRAAESDILELIGG